MATEKNRKPGFLSAVFLIAVSAFGSEAYGSTLDQTLYFGAGLLNRNSGAVATDATNSSMPLFGEIYGQLAVSAFFDLGGALSLSPDLHYTPIGLTESDTLETTRILAGAVRLNYATSKTFDLHLGPGLQFYTISGESGTIDLSNGASTTTFARPDSSATSINLYWDGGVGFNFDSLRIEASVWAAGLLTSRRTFSPVVSLSWGLL
jgi:hypothetical protein